MHDIQTADVFDTSNNLLEKSAGLFLFDPLDLDDIVEKFTALGVFHDEVEFLLSLDDFIELNDLRMTDDLEDVNLSGDTFHIGNVADLRLLEDFDGHFLACRDMCAQFDLAKSALSDGFPKEVLPDRLIWPFLGVSVWLLRHFLNI